MIIVSPNNSVQGMRLFSNFDGNRGGDSSQTVVELASSASKLWSPIGHGLLGTKEDKMTF